METKTLIGHQLQNTSGECIDPATGNVAENPALLSLPEAYRFVADYLDDKPNAVPPAIVPVYETRELTPLETASAELADLLFSLTKRHGLDLGLTKAQAMNQIAKELCELGAAPTAR